MGKEGFPISQPIVQWNRGIKLFFQFNLGTLCLAKATTISGTWLNLEFEKPEKTYGRVVLFLKTSTCLKSKLIFLS